MEKVQKPSNSEHMRVLFISHIGLFDTVFRGKLENKLKTKGYPEHLNLYVGTVISTDRWESVNSGVNIFDRGVGQGCSMSPSVFNNYIDAAVYES
jgi:hypothetical protein